MNSKEAEEVCKRCADAAVSKIYKPLDYAFAALQQEESLENAQSLINAAEKLRYAGWIDQELCNYFTEISLEIAKRYAKK